MGDSPGFEILNWIHSGLGYALLIAIAVERIRAWRRRRELRRVLGADNASQGGAPTLGRMQGDPDGWARELAGRVDAIHVVSLLASGDFDRDRYECFIVLRDGAVFELAEGFDADALIRDARWAGDLLGVAVEVDAPGRDADQLRSAPECHSTLDYERSLRARSKLGGFLLLGAALVLFSLSLRHQGLVEALHDDQQTAYEAAVEDAERVNARREFLNDKRRAYWDTNPPERQNGGEPPLPDEQLQREAEARLPEPPEPHEIAGWTIAYGVLGVAAALWGLLIVVRRRPEPVG